MPQQGGTSCQNVSRVTSIGLELLLNKEANHFLGKNTTVTLKAYTNTIPSLPRLGAALSRFEIEVPLPKLRLPGQGDGNNGPLIKDATVLFSLLQSFKS